MSEENILASTVLVYAEDEDEIRGQVTTFLKRRVKEIYQACNGEEGFELVKKHDPDVVLTDLEMPVMNGLEFIKKVREHYNDTKPIIVLTGYSDEAHYTELADCYVYKPIDLINLTEIMEDLLEKHKVNKSS